ncbi:MAG: hypothetical protein ACK515_22870 [bacterium]|jgi:hypothetical protein|nr:hypothetical protein [Betaproteobacteria bacterium]
MSEDSAASHAGGRGHADDADATQVAPAGDPDASVAPDMAPTADAFDTMAAFDTSSPGLEAAPDDAGDAADGDGPDSGVAPAARGGLLARLPGERRHWMLAGMVSGGILFGGLASAGVAWKMISSRNAEVEARTARLDLQSSRIAEQEARIEVLTRAVKERPLPDEAGTAPDRTADGGGAALGSMGEPSTPSQPQKAAQPPAPSATAVDPAPAAKAADPPSAAKAAPPAPAAKAAESATAAKAPAPPLAPVPASSRAEVAPAGSTAPAGAGAASPSVAGSGICDVPGGTAGAAQMRKCIEWFAGRGKPPATPPP